LTFFFMFFSFCNVSSWSLYDIGLCRWFTDTWA
jgi:hypothetical protein